MIRFTWRQFRLPALVIAALLVAVAVTLLLTGPHMAHLYDATVKDCRAKSDCAFVTNALTSEYNKQFQFMEALSTILPGILGIFWGAPLIARELETGTFRLAWSQSVTRSRWILTKLALVGGASMVAAGLLSWMLTWWASPIDTINANRFQSLVFDTHYIAPIGYAAFAFALGVTTGVLMRRTLPAMATTLVVFIAARLSFASYVRPHLMTPLKKVIAISNASNYGFGQTPNGLQFFFGTPNQPNAMAFNAVAENDHGVKVTTQWLKVNCPKLFAPPPGPSKGGKLTGSPPAFFTECINKISANFHEVLSYQPASRFWTFQWYEASVFTLAGIVLCALSYWWVCRRIR